MRGTQGWLQGPGTSLAQALASDLLLPEACCMPFSAIRLFVAIPGLLADAASQQPSPAVQAPRVPAATTAGDRPTDHPADHAYHALLARLAERPGDVAQAIAQVASPAARARLQAAFGPAEQRPMAMLAVAHLFPDDPEADFALLAAAAALLVQQGRGDAVPELAQWNGELSEAVPFGTRARAALLPTVVAVQRAIEARRERGGDPQVLAQASALLTIACVSRGGGDPVWLRSEARFQAPEDLREPIELAWHPRTFAAFGGSLSAEPLLWHELHALGDPVQRVRLEPHRGTIAPTVPSGHYLLTVRSTTTPWWAVQPIEVSDLEALAVLEDQALVLATWGENRSIAAHFVLTGACAEQRGAVVGHGTVIPLEPALRQPYTAFALQVASDAGPARLHGHTPPPYQRPAHAGWLLHTMVDRPVYRPGETVRGRLVLRRCDYDGDGRAAVPTTTAATACEVRLHASFGDAGAVVLSGRTDEHGLLPFEFEIPELALPTSGVMLAVDVPDVDDADRPLQLAGGRPFAIAPFERRATSLDCAGPELLPEPGESDRIEVAARVRYASGAPVEGQLVHAEFAGRTTALRTGPDGRATLRIHVADWQAWWLRERAGHGDGPPSELVVAFRTIGPDGKPEAATHTVQRLGARTASTGSWPWSPDYDEPRIDLEPMVVGRTTRIVVHGRPGARAMLVVGRSIHARAFPLQFDEQGRASQLVLVQRVDWPRLEVALVERDALAVDGAFVTLREAVPAVVEAPASAPPDSELRCRVRSGRPGALVTLAVVDERVFAIEADRTREPTVALRPWLPTAAWQRLGRARLVAPEDVLTGLLENGRLPPLDDGSFGHGGPSSCGGPAASGVGEPPLRSDFRSVAHFDTQLADADGLATFPVRLPSDLTTWRLTAVVVDEHGEGAIADATTSTRLPWSVEPVLPRPVREGDTFALPLVIARAVDATDATTPVAVEVDATASLAQLGPGTGQPAAAIVVPPGSSRCVTVPMRALGSGAGQLGLTLRGATLLDRSQRPIPIARDTVARPLVVAQRGVGTVRVPLPDGADADEPLQVDVLLGDAMVWSRLEQDLAVYPYGCAEQTLSKLLPYFAAARASVRRGEPLPAMDQAFRRRLRAGLGRLRQLRVAGAQFAFWPGGAVDHEISVLVKHGLAVLREAGVDLAAEGLDVAGTFALPAPLSSDASVDDRAAFARAIEAAAATLRLAPDRGRAQQLAAVALVEHDGARVPAPPLSPGAIARLGLALLAAGAHDEARACLLALDRAQSSGDGSVRGAGEDPLAVQSMQLELRLALDDDDEALERAIADLVLRCAAQRGSTYGQGCAVAALALAVPPAAAQDVDVVVAVGDERRTLHLDGRRAELGRASFPRSGELVVHGPAEAVLLVRVTAARSLRGSSHPAWQKPLTVERTLHTLPGSPDAAACQRALRQPLDASLPVAEGPLPAGHPVLLVVRTSAPTTMHHVVVECPLPCGFEVLGAPTGVERFAEHVAFVSDLYAGHPFEQRLLLVPTTVGRFAWPPTVAAPMYAKGHDGGCAGAVVEVVAPAKGREPAAAEWQPPPTAESPRVVPPWQPRPGSAADDDTPVAAIDVLRACWQRSQDAPWDSPDLALATARALGFDPAASDPWDALARLDDWLYEAARNPSHDPSGAARDAEFVSWLVDLLLATFDRALDTPIPSDAGTATAQVGTAHDALAHVADATENVFRRIALLRRAATGAPDLVATVLDELPADPELAENWPGHLELLHLVLVHPAPEARRLALDRLATERQQTLPVGVLLHARGADWDADFVRRLVHSDRQRAEFALALHDADLVFDHRDELLELLPPTWWPQLPLRVFERLADVTYPDADPGNWNVPQLAGFVARGPCPDAALVQAFAGADDDTFRAVLAHALRSRGVRDLGSPKRPDDASFAAWAKAVSLAANDVDGAVLLLRSHSDEDGAMATGEPQRSIAHFLRRLVVDHGTPQQVHTIARAMDEAAWTRVYERLPADERVQLVDRFPRHLAEGFLPATAAEAEAIWRFLLRSGDLAAMHQLTQTTEGVRCARRHVAAGDGGALAVDLRKAFAEALDLDVTTLEAPVASEGNAIVQAHRRSGRDADLTARGRAWLERLRRQLGATPPVR